MNATFVMNAEMPQVLSQIPELYCRRINLLKITALKYMTEQ